MSATRLFLLPVRLAIFALVLLAAAKLPAAEPPVTVSESDTAFTLANGLVTAQVSKRSGDLISLRYQNRELLAAGSGHAFGYWSQDASRGRHVTQITIDPRTNDGERGEVSVKSIYEPTESGAGGFGGFNRGPACDIEIRYTLERGLSGVYACSIFTHQTNDPATAIGEARFAAKLNPEIVDYLNVDANRRRIMPTPEDWLDGTELNFLEARRLNTGLYKGQVEHKYDYSANQFDTRTYGWLGTKSHIGLWFINPSAEYLSGGPTKYELTGHLDISDEAYPVLLNYWRSSHYGGAICNVGTNEAWAKVIGPFLIYCDAAPTPNAMWQLALQRAKQEAQAWPYDWVEGVDYPHRMERGTVTGQLIVDDAQAPSLQISNLLVGLSAPAYIAPTIFNRFRRFSWFDLENDESETNSNSSGQNRFRRYGLPQTVDWQNDARDYEFWVRGGADGGFSIHNVRPGRYTLHAIADGVLGEFVLSNVTVAAGGSLDLGRLAWQPVRYGRQLWDIGIPNRSAREFFKGDDYNHWGWYVQYPRLFPQDINYVIGQSEFQKDWFFEQVPHDEDLTDTNAFEDGRSTTWSVAFKLPESPQGRAILRLAICGVGTRTRIAVSMNDCLAGTVTDLVYNATINRDGIAGSWSEHDVAFDASLMRAGTNVLKLTIPGGSLTSGVMYDYLRLELAETNADSQDSEHRTSNAEVAAPQANRTPNGQLNRGPLQRFNASTF